MSTQVYYGGLSAWPDVQEAFKMTEVEPAEVIVAAYAIDGYEGSAFVLYRTGRHYYLVEGGHCSCYGLEGQWQPEKYTKKLLIAALKKRGEWGVFGDHKQQILEALS